MGSRSKYYQLALIFLGAVATAFFGVFLFRELYPEYRIFQNDYIALENFYSTYTNNPAPHFQLGVKQILIETPNNGQPIIDRCTSCHVALDIPYFSPTKVAYDVNGKVILDEKGVPVKIPNEDYIWGKLDQRIAALMDEKVNKQLQMQGDLATYTARLKEAEELKSLKTVQIGEHVYDVTKALAMHPLIGRETRPFQYHPVVDYGCTSCHSGNGRALTVDKAHGPVFDGQYEAEYRGPEPKFLETDKDNDPRIATIFNHKPGDALIFQTTPILVDHLIQAKCMQCHQTGEQSFLGALEKTQNISGNTSQIIEAIEISYEDKKKSLLALYQLKMKIEEQGFNKTVAEIQQRLDNYLVPPENRKEVESQLQFLMQAANKGTDEQKASQLVLNKINQQIEQLIGSPQLVLTFFDQLKNKKANIEESVDQFVRDNLKNSQASGSLFASANSLELEKALFTHVRDTETSFSKAVNDQRVINAIQTDVDRLTQTYQRGRELYIEQACYACHRIAGFTRGGVGPELTNIGKNYPWYIKRHIVWPQGDLPTSTMPNTRLDHAELEPLMTFLLAQRGLNDSQSKSEYKRALADWEGGKQLPWEKPITPEQIYDLRYSMTVFATEGCASCHRLKGFESDVGYRVEKEKNGKVDFETLYNEREWFTRLFPEDLQGSELVHILDTHAKEIDQHILDGVRQGSILEEISQNFPESIEAFYTNFRFASRAKNHYFEELSAKETDPNKKKEIEDQFSAYKKRLHRVLMIYIQEYGLGRMIGPKPNWAGVYRSDAWLMEHFHKPSALVARSIMPVFPFDDSKFYALTHMLDVLGKRNRDWDRQLWEIKGFNPELAFQMHCAQCHGEYLGGNGPVSVWIYPVPKNLRNAEFLRNYTRERVVNSIMHGVKGTPMPPWGEASPKPTTQDGIPVLTQEEIKQLTEWLFSTIPGGTVIQGSQDVPKWNYEPEDVIKEMEQEGSQLNTPKHSLNLLKKTLPQGDKWIASLNPIVANKQKVDESGSQVREIFDVVPNPSGAPDKYSYYIKKKFYTDENIQIGRQFFEINCATCHGSEADGMGPRAGVMQEAKPRMLTNLDWIGTHDDLYLLRSIKYGVPGTSMVAWGDQTNALLRNQLVIYIRSLSEESSMQKQLDEALYQSFDSEDFKIDAARVNEVKMIKQTEKELLATQDLKQQLFKDAQTDPSKQKEAIEAYKKELELSEKLNEEKKIDTLLVQLKKLLIKEKKIFAELGNALLSSHIDEQVPQIYLEIIKRLQGRFTVKDGELQIEPKEATEKQIQSLKKKMLDEIDQEVSMLNNEKIIKSARINSSERDSELSDIETRLKSLTALKDKLETSFQEAYNLRKQQEKLINPENEQKNKNDQT